MVFKLLYNTFNFRKSYSWTTIFALLSIAVCSFGIGTTEFVPAGILPEIANHFNVSIPTAAFTVSWYALGVGISGPLLTAGTISLSRKYVLACLMVLFTVGSIISALATTFNVLVISRIITSLCHGSFFGIGAVVVSSIVPPNKRASAIAAMFTGLTLSNVLGVPFGTFIGQTMGWRAVFWIIALMGGVGLIGLLVFLPEKLNIPRTRLKQELLIFKNPRIWGALLTTALGFSGLITCFTYIAPIMRDIAAFPASSLSWLIALYGIGLVIGNIIGGKAADRALIPALYTSLIALACILAIFTFTAYYKFTAAITLFFIGLIGFSLVPSLVRNVMVKAENAPTLASTVNISAFNLGISLSVYLGGLAINAGLGYTSPMWLGCILAIIALGVAVISNFPGSSVKE